MRAVSVPSCIELVIPTLSTDHSPLLITLLNDKFNKSGNGFWTFNNSLVYDAVYVEKRSLQKSIIQTNLLKTPNKID